MEIFEVVPLTKGDLAKAEVKSLGRPKGAVGWIRERHHTMAKLYAAGFNFAEISRMVGMTPAGVRLWVNNPANAELISEYAGDQVARTDAMIDRRIAMQNEIAVLATMQLKEQLLEDIEAGNAIPYDKLVKLAAHVDDRTGLGRQETKVNLNMDLGSRLDKAKARQEELAKARAEGKVVEFVRRA